jgi:hypothetical protein
MQVFRHLVWVLGDPFNLEPAALKGFDADQDDHSMSSRADVIWREELGVAP